MTSFIAERKLLYSTKNSKSQREITVKISQPYVVKQEDVKFPVDGVTSCCCVEIDGLEGVRENYYGMDLVQALNLATNIDPLIERLSDKYDFFWATGDPYFED